VDVEQTEKRKKNWCDVTRGWKILSRGFLCGVSGLNDFWVKNFDKTTPSMLCGGRFSESIEQLLHGQNSKALDFSKLRDGYGRKWRHKEGDEGYKRSS
jgi:hypothetical protein